MISLSSPPVARYLPPQDQRTLLTQAEKGLIGSSNVSLSTVNVYFVSSRGSSDVRGKLPK